MYYLHIYNSEKEEGSIVLPFEDMQPMINFVVDQYQKTIKRLKTNNKKYQKITSTWDKNKYDETLEESIKNFEFGIFCSMEITGLNPVILSTSGRSIPPSIFRAYAVKVSM